MWEEAYKLHPNNLRIKRFLSQNYGSLSWYCLFDKDFKGAETAARRGLELDQTEIWIITNLANASLLQGRYAEAENIYKQFKGQSYDEERSWSQVFLEDLDALAAAGVTHPDVKKARAFLQK